MRVRFLLVLMFSLIPLAGLAATSDTQNAPASGLGPGQTTTGAGGSSADGGTLQPAGLSPLQSTTNDSSGLTSPTNQALQAPVTPDAHLQVLAGEGDGTPQQFDDKPLSVWNWLIWSSLVLLMAVLALLGWQFFQRRRRGAPVQTTPTEDEVATEELEKPSEEPEPPEAQKTTETQETAGAKEDQPDPKA
jgi:hypothetical protein